VALDPNPSENPDGLQEGTLEVFIGCSRASEDLSKCGSIAVTEAQLAPSALDSGDEGGGLDESPLNPEESPAGPEVDAGEGEESPAGPEADAGEGEDAPEEGEESPAGPEADAGEGEDAPEEGEESPAGPEADAGEGEDAPEEGEESPAGPEADAGEGEDAPEEGEESPAGPEESPAGPEDNTAGGDDGPSDGFDAPDFQTDDSSSADPVASLHASVSGDNQEGPIAEVEAQDELGVAPQDSWAERISKSIPKQAPNGQVVVGGVVVVLLAGVGIHKLMKRKTGRGLSYRQVQNGQVQMGSVRSSRPRDLESAPLTSGDDWDSNWDEGSDTWDEPDTAHPTKPPTKPRGDSWADGDSWGGKDW